MFVPVWIYNTEVFNSTKMYWSLLLIKVPLGSTRHLSETKALSSMSWQNKHTNMVQTYNKTWYKCHKESLGKYQGPLKKGDHCLGSEKTVWTKPWGNGGEQGTSLGNNERCSLVAQCTERKQDSKDRWKPHCLQRALKSGWGWITKPLCVAGLPTRLCLLGI